MLAERTARRWPQKAGMHTGRERVPCLFHVRLISTLFALKPGYFFAPEIFTPYLKPTAGDELPVLYFWN